MSHVDDGTLHALVDNELDATERSAVEAHLASCGDCARRFADATAMARQVVSLLGALDADAGAVRVVMPTVPPVMADEIPPGVRRDARVIPLPTRFRTLRRLAVAASVVVVAGVSYQVGRTRDAAPNEPAVSMVMADRAPRPMVTPSVVDAMPDSVIAESAPAARQKPRNGPRNDSEMSPVDRPDGASGGARVEADSKATAAAVVAPPAAPAAPRAVVVPLPAVSVGESAKDSATQRGADAETRSRESADALGRVQAQELARAQQGAPAQSGPSRIASQRRMELGQVVVTGVAATANSTANVSSGKAAPAKATPLAGYTALEDESLPSLTRRRYVSANGTPIVLLIIKPPTEQKRTPPPETESSFVVSSTNGTSSVRWRARGREYELQGPLAPDSLLKLAARLK